MISANATYHYGLYLNLTGGYKQHRATGYLYAFGKCLVGSADGRMYTLDPLANSQAGDP